VTAQVTFSFLDVIKVDIHLAAARAVSHPSARRRSNDLAVIIGAPVHRLITGGRVWRMHFLAWMS